jgi:hypothetical protein
MAHKDKKSEKEKRKKKKERIKIVSQVNPQIQRDTYRELKKRRW